MFKAKLSNFLRKLGLIYFTDWLRFYFQKFKNRRINQKFVIDNPDVKLPSDYLIYESFQLNYEKYYTESIESAKWLTSYFKKYSNLNKIRILDWGCGPGRIIRHLPSVIGNNCEFYATDYNKKSIDWCSANLEGIHFNINSLEASLPYPDNFFGAIYGISIFTHLSEEMHYEWFNELLRVLDHNGILFLTTQGENFKAKLTEKEVADFNNDKLVIRGNVKEGHRTFSAFHPRGFMLKLFSEMQILDHVETKPMSTKWLPQDIWILKKI